MIAITGRKILIFFLIIILGIAVYQSFGKSFGPSVVEKINTDVGLNQIATNYSQKFYEEVVVKGQQLKAKKSVQNSEDNGKMTQIREIDAITLPATLNIADIGFLKEDNGTKITIEEAKWYELLVDAVPSFLGTIILFFLFIFFWAEWWAVVAAQWVALWDLFGLARVCTTQMIKIRWLLLM